MKKNRTAFVAIALTGVLALTTLAAGVKSITADLRPDMTVRIDGTKQTMMDVDGNVVHPIAYEGTTYLPIRAIGNLMDYDVTWDGKTQTVILDQKTHTPSEDLTMEKLTPRVDAAERAIANLKSGSTYAERVKQYSLHSQTVDVLRKDVADYSQKVNDQLRKGEITYADYNILSGKIGDLDVRLKNALEKLENKTIHDETGKLTLVQQVLADIQVLENKIDAQETAVKALKSAATATLRKEQYDTMAPALVLLNQEVSTMYNSINANLREGRINYDEYHLLSKECGEEDVELKEVWQTLSDKTIAMDDPQLPQGETSKTYDAYVKAVDALQKKAEGLEKDVNNYKPAQGENNNKQAYRNLMTRIDELEREMDRQEDAFERDYRDGKLTATQYRALDRLLDKAEDKTDDLDDRLENKVDDRYDDDNDWDDDDRYDDDRYDDDWDD